MPLPANLVSVAELAAATHKLPADLVKAIILTESGGNPVAMRYEPAFAKRYVPPAAPTFGASKATEQIARATSWGLMQVMGQVAREMGCKEPYLSALCDPVTGIHFGCLLLAKLRDRHYEAHGWDGVISAYNQGSPRKDESGEYINQPYVMKVKKFIGDAL
jgi:soluble lytic murein transglycosylase-like protein